MAEEKEREALIGALNRMDWRHDPQTETLVLEGTLEHPHKLAKKLKQEFGVSANLRYLKDSKNWEIAFGEKDWPALAVNGFDFHGAEALKDPAMREAQLRGWHTARTESARAVVRDTVRKMTYTALLATVGYVAYPTCRSI